MYEACVNVAELEKAYQKNFDQRGELGASLSVWKDGEEVVSLHQGWCEREQERSWTAETVVPFYSTTKGLSAATLLLVLERNGMTPDDRVCDVWEGFPVKEGTLGQLMSHRLGVAALDVAVSTWDYEGVIAAVENMAPNWPMDGPDSGHGYHPRVMGFLQDEIVRRIAGKPLGVVWRELIADPLGLEAWIGLPESEFGRVATLYPGKYDQSDLESDFYKAFNTPGSITKRAFFSPRGMHSVREMNEPRAWQAGFPAIGGIGTASAVAKFYQAACGAVEFFPPQVLSWMGTPLCNGWDKILQAPTSFSCGFQFDPVDEAGRKIRHHYGLSRRAFGHPGAGGSLAFGDPENGLSFCYTMNQMELSPLPKEKCLDLTKAIYVL